MGLTTAATLARGERIGQGAEAAYHRLVAGPGEQHLLRLDLVSAEPSPTQRRSLLHLACLTDLHLVDAQSPGRFEFADRYHGLPAADPLLPTYRPQEFLQPHAVEAMLRTVQSIEGSPLTGAPISSLICLGDQIDNGQWNELRWFLRLMQGGPLAVTSPGSAYRGVAAVSWDDPFYWHPDEYPDEYRRRWGFPSYPGALEDACLPIQARGVALPWRVCIGNHDPFIQGTAAFSPSFAALITGDRKVRAIPPDFDPASQPVGPQAGLDLLDLFVRQPEVFLTGLAVPIRPDPDRRPFGRREWIAAFLQAGGAPPGHGFSRHHLDSGETYYVDDYSPLVRLIVLDTVNPGADYMGSVGTRQLAWLEERLAEVHDRYFDASGRQVRTGCVDRLVVVCSHHGRDSLINDRVGGDGDEDLPRRLGPDVEAVLHRFPQCGPLAQRPHPPQHRPPATRPIRAHGRVLGGDDVLPPRLALPGAPRRTDRQWERHALYTLHHNRPPGPRRSAPGRGAAAAGSHPSRAGGQRPLRGHALRTPRPAFGPQRRIAAAGAVRPGMRSR